LIQVGFYKKESGIFTYNGHIIYCMTAVVKGKVERLESEQFLNWIEKMSLPPWKKDHPWMWLSQLNRTIEIRCRWTLDELPEIGEAEMSTNLSCGLITVGLKWRKCNDFQCQVKYNSHILSKTNTSREVDHW